MLHPTSDTNAIHVPSILAIPTLALRVQWLFPVSEPNHPLNPSMLSLTRPTNPLCNKAPIHSQILLPWATRSTQAWWPSFPCCLVREWKSDYYNLGFYNLKSHRENIRVFTSLNRRERGKLRVGGVEIRVFTSLNWWERRLNCIELGVILGFWIRGQGGICGVGGEGWGTDGKGRN